MNMKWKGPLVVVLIAIFTLVPLSGFQLASAATGNEPVPAFAVQVPSGPPAGAKTCERFATGFLVCDDFLRYFHSYGLDLGDPGISTRESIMLWGYPLTQPFVYADGRYIQVFERAVFELHPEFAGSAFYVEYRRLGADELSSFPKAFQNASAVTCDQFYSQTGKCLSGDFLKFWNNNGGLPIFGYPMTNATDLDGIWSQVMERWIFELHPENKGTPYYVEGRRVGADWLAARMPGSQANCTAKSLGSFNPGDSPTLDATGGIIIANVWGNKGTPNFSLHKTFLDEGQVWHFTQFAGGDAVQYPKGCTDQAKMDFGNNPNPSIDWNGLHDQDLVK